MAVIYMEVLPMKLKKNIMIDEDVYLRVLQYANDNGISFSGAVSVLAGQALTAMKSIDSVENLVKLMTDIQQEQKKSIREDHDPQSEAVPRKRKS